MTSTRNPPTAVVIATYDRADLLRRTLESLHRSRGSDALSEVLVMENGARAGTEEVCEQFVGRLPIEYRFLTLGNKCNALNEALAATVGEFIIFHDDDVEVGANTVESYLDAARRHGRGHYFGGPVEPIYDDVPPPDWLRDSMPICTRGWDLGSREQPYHEYLGANWAAFGDDIVKVGGFDAGLGPGQSLSAVRDETELQARMASAGMRGIYVPAARVGHHVPAAHCSLDFAVRRRYLNHLSETLIRPRHAESPTLLGVPRFLWRSWAAQAMRVLASRAIDPRSKERVRRELRLAELRGQAAGYRELARGRGLDGPRPAATV